MSSSSSSTPIVVSIIAIILAAAALGLNLTAAPAEQGPPGPQGQQGPPGPQGPAGAIPNPEDIQIETKHGTLTLADLAEIQPGLGTIMIEYGNRFYHTYYAAKDGNWGLAGYQLKEALEIQEVGEITRPGKAAMLKAFEDSYMGPLKDAIDAQDWNAFQAAYNNAISGCNGCHAATGHPYIEYSLPSTPPALP